MDLEWYRENGTIVLVRDMVRNRKMLDENIIFGIRYVWAVYYSIKGV